MSQKELLYVYDSKLIPKTAYEFLQAVIDSRDKKKILVQFKFKGSNVGYEQWITRKQYLFLKEMTCVEFCEKVS